MFLRTGSEKFDNHLISSDLQSLSNYIPLLISIIIEGEFIQEKKQSIVRNSNEEKEFNNELIYKISSMETVDITNYKELEHVTEEFAFTVKDL